MVIGFSIPDNDVHFKYLLAAGLADNVSLRSVWFVDESRIVQERADSLFNSHGRKVHEVKPMWLEAFMGDFAQHAMKLGRGCRGMMMGLSRV